MALVVHGYYGRGNLGDELALRSLADLVGRDRLLATSTRPGYTLREQGLRSVYSGDVHGVAHLAQRRELLRALDRADALVFGGGTFLHSADGRFLRPGPWVPYLVERCRRRGVRVVFAAIGLGPFGTAYSRQAARWVLRRGDAVLVRDPTSLGLLKEVAPDVAGRVELGVDLAMLLKPPPRPASRRIVGVNVVAHASRSWTPARQERFLDAAGAALDRLAGEGLRLRFLAFQTSGPDDREAGQALARRMRDPAALDIVAPGPGEVLPELAAMDSFLGTRLHSVVGARLCGTPYLAVPYHAKVRDLVADFGDAARLVPDGDDGAALAERVLGVGRKPLPPLPKPFLERRARTAAWLREALPAP